MNALFAFTRRSLKKNGTRTLVTILGITVSMIMLTAVTLGGHSGQKFFERVTLESEGAYHGYWHGLTDREVEEARNVPNQGKVSVWKEVGFADIGSTNEYKPYLRIFSIDKEAPNLVAINLTSGRMPKKEGEILLPDHLKSNGGVTFDLGQTLRLDVGKREVDGQLAINDMAREPLDFQPGHEKIVQSRPMTFTVVGTYQRLSFDLEPVSMPAYTALTRGRAEGPSMVLFTFEDRAKGIKDYQDREGKIKQAMETDRDWNQVDKNLPGNLKFINYHEFLLQTQGSVTGSPLVRAIWTLATILIVIIALATISLIYNAFSISVMERTRQYGMLRSIGATNRQILLSILYEGLIVSLPAVLLGAVLGYLGLFLAFNFARSMAPDFTYVLPGRTIQIEPVISLAPLLLAALLCILTTLISAFLPARRAMKMTPIQALRMEKDVKLKARQVKTSGFWSKHFGVEGGLAVKNQKREKGHQRATVFSLALSVILFVTSSAFIGQVQSTMNRASLGDNQADISYHFWDVAPGLMAQGKEDSGETENGGLAHQEDLLKKIRTIPGIDRSSLSFQTDAYVLFPPGVHHDKLVDARKRQAEEGSQVDTDTELFLAQWDGGKDLREGIKLAFLDDAYFRTYIQSLGQDPNAYFESGKVRGVLLNRTITYQFLKSGGVRSEETPYLKEEEDLTLSILSLSHQKGYVEAILGKDQKGSLVYTYIPDLEGKNTTTKESLVKSPDQVESAKPVSLGTMTDRAPLGGGAGQVCIYFPLSRVREVFPEEDLAHRDFHGAISVTDQENSHDRVMEEVKRISDEDTQRHTTIDVRNNTDLMRRMVTMVGVFATLFIIFISLIVIANMFNAISTNMILRRRDFAILKTVGMDDRQLNRMLVVEGAYYGIKALLVAIPLSLLACLGMAKVMQEKADIVNFYIPWASLAIAVGTVVVVVFITIAYARKKLDLDHPMAWIKGETF
ncbi:ABC transporter permease [Kallipyga gabonensis]|uniref:ABC transporter permease n=1 Tax=Kallipyga gabonensis TaxID=1686287 RepID=UPI0006B46C6A|nr:ABC transporter permease [Kallipyga gabonensis]